MANTPLRSIRVSDEIWDKATQVAAFHDTTVTEMVVTYLKKLHMNGTPKDRPQSVAKGEVRRRCGVQKHMERTGQRDGLVNSDPKRFIEPEVCEHPVLKTIPYGTFCLGCGKRMV